MRIPMRSPVRRPMRRFSTGAAATIAVWKSAPMLRPSHLPLAQSLTA